VDSWASAVISTNKQYEPTSAVALAARIKNFRIERDMLLTHSNATLPPYPAIQERLQSFMSNDQTFRDRLNHASEAKRAMLAKFRRAQDPENPAAIEKRQQREAIAEARAERAAQREAARQKREIELAKRVALAAQAAAEAERAAAEQAARHAAEQSEREAALKAQQKADRDDRYAARKAAKKVRRRGY
jgi:hypothetical protein